MKTPRTLARLGLVAAALVAAACGSADKTSGSGGGGGAATGGSAGTGGSGASSPNGSGAGSEGGSGPNAGPGAGGAGTGGAAGIGGSSGPGAGGGAPVPQGWLYTVSGDNKVHLSDGQSGSIWVGRGVNADDIFLCGYNYGMWMMNPDGEAAMLDVVTHLADDWKASFFRISLSMNSYQPVVGWVGDNDYKTSMTNVIHALGAIPNTYVLVTLRSDTTMVDGNGAACGQSDDAVCIPTHDTDAVYRALVDSFKDAPYVLFGLSNEPGGQSASNQELSDAMSHAVGVIRAEEDALGVPHHLVSVQGNGWTSDISFYDTAPLPYDNVVYEYHSYPPLSSGYTQAHIPVIIGEYGTPFDAPDDPSFSDAFYADVDAKQIPNLAWDAAAYSPCQPDLLVVTHDASLTTTNWGAAVKKYLKSH